MKSKRVILTVVAGLAVLSWASVWGYPRPGPSPRSWQLEFKYGPMKMVRVSRLGGKLETFWYLPYTVTNNTGRDVSFYPRCFLFTDTGQLVKAMTDVDALAYPDITKLLGRQLLEEEVLVRGRLLQGEENARESVIIIKDFDAKAASFKLFIAGISGEQVHVTDPMSGKKYPLDKTLQLTYGLGGERMGNMEMTAQLRDEEWVMR